MMPTAIAASDGPAVANPTITVRDIDGAERESSLGNASEHVLRTAQPWRTFRWYYGQRHYSGTYATATMSQSRIYESRLELARLLLADFDPDVTHMVSQPFLMRAVVDSKTRRHVPDFLLFGENKVTVVDVKPRSHLDDPTVVATFAWVRRVVENRGWFFEIASEPERVLLNNVRFLAGFRHPKGISAEILLDLRDRALVGRTLAESTALIDAPAPCVRAALFHMLWRHELSVDLTRRLSSQTTLEVAK